VNDAPVAAADSYEWYEDGTLTVYGMGVLGNDYDVEWDSLSATLVSAPAHGTLTLSADGGFSYTPEANFYGVDSFVYCATDPAGLGSEATVSITIWGMNDPIEVAVPGSQEMAEDTSLTFSTANGNAITITDVESPTILVALFVQEGILTLANTDGLEFPDPSHMNNSREIVFYADNPAEANAALNGLAFTPDANTSTSTFGTRPSCRIPRTHTAACRSRSVLSTMRPWPWTTSTRPRPAPRSSPRWAAAGTEWAC
jgi:VCBS repeat-containing protein